MSQNKDLNLDPQDWKAFAATAHEALDAAIQHLREASERPWRPLPDEARAEIDQPLPRGEKSFPDVVERVKHSILPYPTGNAHPRFWGWVMGNGTADGMVADMLAAAMNAHGAGYDQSASAVERRVITWLNELMGYPANASGLLVSGGTMASITGLAVARQVKSGHDIRGQGLHGAPRLRVYGSAETHSWAEKGCDFLGLGRDAMRRVAADRYGRVEPEAIREAIREDRRRGEQPICIIGNAGTVDTGAIDNLDALADICQEEDVWLHVDGAFGALAVLSPSLRPLLKGLERSDSVAFDLHKWGYLQYELGCVLVRDQEVHRETFQTSAAYLTPPGRGIQPDTLLFPELGIQLSRGFRALKVWMAFETHGVDKIGRVIEQNVDQAKYLAERAEAENELELMAPVMLNVACLRYLFPDADPSVQDALNREILLRLQEEGIAVPSSTVRNERFAIRVAITNHRTRRSDIDVLIDNVLRLGRELAEHQEK